MDSLVREVLVLNGRKRADQVGAGLVPLNENQSTEEESWYGYR